MGRGCAGAPAPTGLATYDVDLVEDGQTVVLGDRHDPLPRSARADEVVPEAGPLAPCFRPRLPPDRLVLHDWPADPDTVRTPEAAAASGSARRVLVEGRLVLMRDEPVRLCSPPAGAPPAGLPAQPCPADAPVVRGVHPPPEALFEAHDGLWRIDIAGGDIATITHVRTELAGSTDYPERPEAPTDLGPADLVVVERDAIKIPAGDLYYGQPPEAATLAGTYELRLDNHGNLPHTLINDELAIDLRAEPGQPALTEVELPPGEHTFYCQIPGHRGAGMQLEMAVVQQGEHANAAAR